MLTAVTKPLDSPVCFTKANQDLKIFVKLDIQPDPIPISEVVDALQAIVGELVVYTWYEGPSVVTKLGAQFLQKNLCEPLYKTKTKLVLYSLEAWNFQRNISSMKATTPKGVCINKINKAFVECIYSSSFFRFCTQFNADSSLYRFVNEEIPKKKWLIAISADREERGKTIDQLFEQKTSLADCIKEMDVNKGYSSLQYIEGYYLIREILQRGVEQGKQKIQAAIVLPNDEAQYYRDFPDDIEKMLYAEFSEKLNGIELNIYFKFYKYGSADNERPYLGPSGKGLNVRDSQIGSYLNYISGNQKV